MTLAEYLIFPCDTEKELLPNYFFVFEGEVTEPYFITRFLKYLKEYLYGKAIVHIVEKKNDDKGKTEVKELIKIAKTIIKENSKDGLFKNERDKVFVFFDLDKYKNDQKRIDTLLEKANKNIVLAYTNPAFELFVFLMIQDALDGILIPNKEQILANEYVELENGNKERFIFHLLKETIHIDVKSQKSLGQKDFFKLFGSFENVIPQEERINRYLDCAAGQLTSNIGYLLELLKANNLSDIEYKKKGGGNT